MIYELTVEDKACDAYYENIYCLQMTYLYNMSMYTYKHYLLFSILHFRYSLVIFVLHSISDLLALHTTK